MYSVVVVSKEGILKEAWMLRFGKASYYLVGDTLVLAKPRSY